MFNIFLKSFLTCCLVVGLLPSFSCLCTTKAFAQASTSIYEIIFGESSGSEGFYAENDNDQLLGADDCLPNDNNQPQSTNVGNQSHDVVQNELSQQSYALDSMPVNASDENGASSDENQDLKPQNSNENTTPVESYNSVENSENGFKYVDYEITITTQDIRYAGFDGLVQVKVNGEYGSTGFHTLDKSGYNDFERGDCDLYRFKDRFVGAIKSLTFETDSENSWFLQDASVVVEGQEYFFWANSNWVNGTIDIPVTQQRKYLLEYITFNYQDAESSDNYYICLIGDKGYTGYYNLGSPSQGKTEKSFVSKDVGNLKYAVIGGGQNVSLNDVAVDVCISSVIDLVVQITMIVIMNAITKNYNKNKLKKANKNETLKGAVEKECKKRFGNELSQNNAGEQNQNIIAKDNEFELDADLLAGEQNQNTITVDNEFEIDADTLAGEQSQNTITDDNEFEIDADLLAGEQNQNTITEDNQVNVQKGAREMNINRTEQQPNKEVPKSNELDNYEIQKRRNMPEIEEQEDMVKMEQDAVYMNDNQFHSSSEKELINRSNDSMNANELIQGQKVKNNANDVKDFKSQLKNKLEKVNNDYTKLLDEGIRSERDYRYKLLEADRKYVEASKRLDELELDIKKCTSIKNRIENQVESCRENIATLKKEIRGYKRQIKNLELNDPLINKIKNDIESAHQRILLSERQIEKLELNDPLINKIKNDIESANQRILLSERQIVELELNDPLINKIKNDIESANQRLLLLMQERTNCKEAELQMIQRLNSLRDLKNVQVDECLDLYSARMDCEKLMNSARAKLDLIDASARNNTIKTDNLLKKRLELKDAYDMLIEIDKDVPNRSLSKLCDDLGECPNRFFDHNNVEDLRTYYGYTDSDGVQLDLLKKGKNGNLNFKGKPRPFKDMSVYVQKRLEELSKIGKEDFNKWKLAQYEIDMLKSHEFHYIAGKIVWAKKQRMDVLDVVKISKIIYDHCVISSLTFGQIRNGVTKLVNMRSSWCDFVNKFLSGDFSLLREDALLEDIIDKDNNNSEEARFLKGIYVLGQGLKFEKSNQNLSDKYLSYIKDFNILFYDFCLNAENVKQISTETLSYLVDLLSDLNTFESEYFKNNFKSDELANLSSMLFCVFYYRSGLDNFDNLKPTKDNTNSNNEFNIDNESNIVANNSSDDNNYLRITKQPSKLSYEMLEPLNIEDVVLSLKIADNDPIEINYYDLNKYGISVNHYSGWALSLEDKALVFNYDSDDVKLSTSIPITVEISEDIRHIIYDQGAFSSINSILQLLQGLYGDDEYRLAEDIKKSTLNILNPKNEFTGSVWFSRIMNIWDGATFLLSFPCPIFGLIAVPLKLLTSAIVVAATSSDSWYVNSINVSSPGYSNRTFYCRDWVYAENPEIIPADNVPYDLEFGTSIDSLDFRGDVFIQFESESSTSDSETIQDSSQLFSQTHKIICRGFYAGSKYKSYVADKNIGDISKIKLFTNSNNVWKLEYLNLVVNGKKYICKWGDWVNGTIELVPEKNANEAVYDIKIKTFNSACGIKDVYDAIQIQLNGEDDNSKPTSKSSTFTSESQMVEEGFEVQDLFTNNVSKLKSVTITNTKDCKLPIDYLSINNQKYYVRQVISKDQSVVIDPSDKKSAYDIKFKISDIKGLDCKDNLPSSIKISGKDLNNKDIDTQELPLVLSDSDIASLTSGSEVKFYLTSSINIKDIEKVEIIKKDNGNALPLDYVDIVSSYVDKSKELIKSPEKHFYCGKYFRDSIVLSASDKVYKFDFKNLQGNQLQSLTAYSMSIEGKSTAESSVSNNDNVKSNRFLPALDFNSNELQHLIIGDSCKIDKLFCLDFASESSETNKKWGLDYVTYNGIKANVNSSFSNEESKFRIDFTNRYCVTFHTKDRYNKSHLNFSIIGENKNETKKQYLANFIGDVAAFEDENNIDKIYGIKLNSDSEIFLDSVEVNAPCGSYIFNCYRSFSGDLTLSVEDQVFDVEIKVGDVRHAASDSDISFQFIVNAGSNEDDIVFSRSFEFESKSIERMQARSQRFVLLKSMNEIVENFDQILLTKGSDSDDLFLDYIKINDVIYYYRDWLSGNGQTITIDANSPMTAYNIDVKTSDIMQAGTDCDVSIILENYNGDKSNDISLDLKNVDDRGQNEINYYFIANKFGLNVDKCIVKVSDPGAWAFDYIKITQIDNAGKEKDSHTFYYGRWVDRRETVLSREDKIYSISTKEMDSTAGRAAEYSKNDSYDITLVDTTNKDNPRKSKVLSLPRQCAEKKCASLVHDPNEEPIFNASYIDVHYVGDGLGTLDYVKVDNKTFYCREGIHYSNTKSLYEDYYPYDVCVFTGDRFNAGTDDDVSIKLYVTNSQKEGASTDLMKLDTFWKNDFGRADFLPYNLKDKIELDTITKVEVNKKGSDDWGLDYLTVKLPNGIIYTFDCFDWVTSTVFLYPNSDKIANSPYSLTITTSDSYGAGTDNNIYAKISGFNNQNKYVSTDFHLLDLENNNDFESGDTDTYLIYDSVDIATIDSIELKNEYYGSFVGKPDWRVASADVVHGDNRYHFDCKDEWICSDKSMTFKGPTISNDDSYCVIIRTADEVRAGTDGDIHITVHGKDSNNNDISNPVTHLLDKPGYDDFERNNCDTYLFTDSNKIDKIEKITLTNDTNCDKWCVSSLRLIHNGCDIYEFSCNNSWIGNETKQFMPSGANCPNKNIGESFRVVTKILPDVNCGSFSYIKVKVVGDKYSTGFHESPSYCHFNKGDWDSFSFIDNDIGNTVNSIEFYKFGLWGGCDMLGMDYIYVYYKNRWHKADFNVKLDLDGKDKLVSKPAKLVGVIPSH